MLNFEHIEVPEVGSGFRLVSQTIPLAGMIVVLRAVRQEKYILFRYSVDEGRTYTEWEQLTDTTVQKLSSRATVTGVILECVVREVPVGRATARLANSPRTTDDDFEFEFPVVEIDDETNVGIQRIKAKSFWVLDGDIPDDNNTHTIYDRSIFNKFFDSDDEGVIGWAFNVLEKIYEPGILPLYISRANAEDFNSFFLATTQLFAYIVMYARKYRDFESDESYERGGDMMLQAFIEGWGLIYDNIDTAGERQYLFQHWIEQFQKRGTVQIADDQVLGSDGSVSVLEGELRRLVGYLKPNEFLFAVLTPENVGWCLGFSSPTWYGTETVNNVTKGWDYGIGYTAPEEKRGVGRLVNYPVVGNVLREKDGNLNVFRPTGSGRSGISTEETTEKVFEVYRGLNYEISVWVKALDGSKPQNIDFGVLCYDDSGVDDAPGNLVKSIRLTDGSSTDSFFDGDGGAVNSPCKIPGVYYRLTGVVYGILEDIVNLEDMNDPLYLNFENGRPLRFFSNNVRYMAPYIVQDRSGDVSDIYIAGVTVRPLNLFTEYNTYNLDQVLESAIPKIPSQQAFAYPSSEFTWDEADGTPMLTQISEVGQGYLGQKNVIALYAQINTSRSKSEVEAFMRNYLVSYKNVLMCTWLDYIVRYTVIVTIIVRDSFSNQPIQGAQVTIDSLGEVDEPIHFAAETDDTGIVRLEVEYSVREALQFSYSVVYGEAQAEGTFEVRTSDVLVEVALDIPVPVTVNVIQKGWGTVTLEGSRLPGTDITLNQTPTDGYVFIGWRIEPVGVESTEPSLTYHIVDATPLTVYATFERDAQMSWSSQSVTIPAEGGSVSATLFSTLPWTLDSVDASWLSVSPVTGDGDSEVTFTAVEDGMVTFSILSTPVGARVVINGSVRDSITVAKGTTVSWEVSADGYISQSGSEVVTENTSKTVTLVKVPVTEEAFEVKLEDGSGYEGFETVSGNDSEQFNVSI